MLAYNIVVYITIIWNLCAVRKNISKSQSNKTAAIRRFQNAFAISILLGLSWCFGFLAIGSLRMAFNVLFSLFNSFQGVFIFLIFCLRQEEVRAAWKSRFGIKSRKKKREGGASTSQSNLISTTKDVTTESEITTKTSCKAVGEKQQFELVEVEDSRYDIQTKRTSTFQTESQASTKASGEAEQSELVKAEDGNHEIQTTMASTIQNELKASNEASGGEQQSELLKAENGTDDFQTTTTSTYKNELQTVNIASGETQQSEVVKAENGTDDIPAYTTSTFKNELQTSSEPSGERQQSEVVKAEESRHDVQATTLSTFQNELKASSGPEETQQSEQVKPENGRNDI
ncbi:Adhesion G-protein coupled receptor G6 [Holothuria leucospilota]|uniref:Adhesion G-protein coupled receptor G6 n=1 Tax=Holothuria leucospilota TaxID=206669 RepID=A0A9Q0YDU3_HOLLE|nr:Adhesion G-protein coupled receptor G6 [Holothuria leucospilota]